MARARGSYPRCHWFESSCRYHFSKTEAPPFPYRQRPGGQAVKTPPFHGGNTGSSPVRVTTFPKPFIWRHSSAGRASASHAEGHRFEFCCLHQSLEPKGFGDFSFVRRATPSNGSGHCFQFCCLHQTSCFTGRFFFSCLRSVRRVTPPTGQVTDFSQNETDARLSPRVRLSMHWRG